MFEPRHSSIRKLQILNHCLFFLILIWTEVETYPVGVSLGYLLFHIGHNIGAHRYFCHRQFTTNRFWEVVFHFAFTLNVLGSSIGYRQIHHQHHKFSDQALDPHCPRKRGWFRAYFFSDFAKDRFYLPPRSVKESLRDPVARFFHRYYFLILGSYIALTCQSLTAFHAFYLTPAITAYHLSQFQIVFSHFKLPLSGQSHETHDSSYNHYLLKPIFLGDELHNNHHAAPTRLDQNLSGQWREFDPIAWIVQRFIAS